MWCDRVRFNVVGEPVDPDDRDGECVDVGVAFVSVRDILNQHRDIIEQDMPRKCTQHGLPKPVTL